MSSIAILLGSDPVKGLLAAAIGLLLGTVGSDVVTGEQRFTFGRLELLDAAVQLARRCRLNS